MYKPIPACSCNAAIEYEKDREEEKVHQFVMGLDEARFGVVCQGIIASDSLIDLGDAYAKIVCEEQRLIMNVGASGDAAAPVASNVPTAAQAVPAAEETKNKKKVYIYLFSFSRHSYSY